MALPKLAAPPRPPTPSASTADILHYLSNLSQWMWRVYEWMGKSTGTSPLNISGNASTASTANGVQVVMNAGNPEGNQAASPGVFYIDTAASLVYVKSANNDTTGWQVL